MQWLSVPCSEASVVWRDFILSDKTNEISVVSYKQDVAKPRTSHPVLKHFKWIFVNCDWCLMYTCCRSLSAFPRNLFRGGCKELSDLKTSYFDQWAKSLINKASIMFMWYAKEYARASSDSMKSNHSIQAKDIC